MERELIEKSVLQCCILSRFHITKIEHLTILHEEFFFFKSREKLTGHRIGTWWGKVMKQERERDLLGALRWEGGTGKVYPCLDQFQGIVFHLIFNLKRCLELGLCINKSSWNFLENPSSALENVFAFIRYKENLNTKMFQQQIDLVKLSVTWVMSKILSGEWYR